MCFVAAAALAGLVGSPHCVGMCGAFALTCGERTGALLPWHIGRLTTYATLGALAGGLGAVIPGPGWIGTAVSTVLICWFAAALAGLVPQPTVLVPGLTKLAVRSLRQPGTGSRFLFGLANGLLPCGLVYAALSIPVASGSPLIGATAMLAFGAGTVPALSVLALGIRRLTLESIRARRVLAAGVLIAGLWSVGIRHGLLPGGTHAPHQAEATNSPSRGPTPQAAN